MSLSNLISPLLRKPALNILIHFIYNKFLLDSYCLTIVSDVPIDLNLNSSFMYIIPNSTISDLKEQLLSVSEKGCSDYLVYMFDQALFITAFDQVSKTGNNRRSDRKVIFLPTLGNQSIDDIFSLNETNYIANLLMIVQNNESEEECMIYDLVTHKFEGPDEVVNQPLLLDQWDSCKEEFKTNADLFPHDIKDLYGKTVRVATFTYKPYVLLDVDTAIAPLGRDGLEIRIVDEFCRWVNCSIKILNEWQAQWGDIYNNGTGVGMLGSVFEDKADMGMAAIYSWYDEYVHMDFSAPGIRSAVTCVAPSPRKLASWAMPLFPYTWDMWLAVLMTFLFASLGLTIAKGSFDGTMITVFGVMISQYQRNAEKSWRIRSVTGWLLVGSLVLISAYAGGLASTFTVSKFEPSIDTMQDLIDKNMEWAATHDAWVFSFLLSDEPMIKQMINLFHTYSEEELKIKSFERKTAIGIEKLPGGIYAIADYLTLEALSDMTVMTEEFYYGEVVTVLRKSSVYTEKLNILIRRLQQSGLLLAWETQIALKYLNVKVQHRVKMSRMTKNMVFVKPLSIGNVVGIFMLYAIGVCLSILFFILECLMKNKIK